MQTLDGKPLAASNFFAVVVLLKIEVFLKNCKTFKFEKVYVQRMLYSPNSNLLFPHAQPQLNMSGPCANN